jgi:hypothetical protein
LEVFVDEDAVMRVHYAAALSVAISAGGLYGLARAAGGAAAPVSFKDDVRPIFQVYCASCHQAPDGEGYKASELDLTSYKGLMKGTKYGPMVIPGDPENSNLMRLLDWRASPQLRMPHAKKQLALDERNTIRTWIHQGAKDN